VTQVDKEFIYIIDARHHIDFVNDAWIDFAAENGASGLRRADVLNQSIWKFISDRDTQHIYSIIFKKLHSSRTRIKLPFRCDSPDCRRFMRMEISALDNNRIEFKTWIVKEEKRPSIRLLNPTEMRSAQLLRMCSWCKKVYMTDEDWKEVEEVVELLKLFDTSPLPQFTHTICPPCAELFWAELESEQKTDPGN